MTTQPRLACSLLLVALFAARPAGQPVAPAPKLLVLLVVDQMRADYIDRYGHQWRHGLRRLVAQGAWFRQAAYPYLGTLTCAGHATISTGTLPRTHGLFQNAWWDRASGRFVGCTDDPAAPAIGHGGQASGGHSARWLQVPTFAEQLRAQSPGGARVVAVSLKARSAIMLAGRTADAVLWLDERGVWATSAAYAKGPIDWVDAFVRTQPIARDGGKVWTRRLDPREYLFEDDGPGEQPPAGWQRTFPHELGEALSPQYPARWQESPFADQYLAELALAAVDRLGLGKGRGTDFLAIGFSTLDLVGHDFGPESHEVQDVLVRLDETIGRVLDALDRSVGAGRYLVALSADHGVSPIPERSLRQGLDAGRVNLSEVGGRIDQALGRILGQGRYVATVVYTDIYLGPGVYERLRATPQALEAALEAARQVPGVWKVFHRDALQAATSAVDPETRSAALSYVAGRSGDLVLIPRPYWITAAAAATHGTSHLYDARVPIILMGPGIVPGQYFQPASPADLAPTLAALSGVTLASTDGRVLAEALAAPVTESRDPVNPAGTPLRR